ncbi:NADH-quinone oxidoreductase subunit NuoI [Sulfurospirillum arsenophilum]|uniref:NADH-quinone oxidoreductase subunit NuoI n=1 Tax=Sulfurospirillum arsenophilum TaxID=56698 RepID=UPI0005A8A696|nr:NADH-quinone oxidoreductase subunit NuoI [Sulfurospirillum arsenophilum]
MELKDFKQRNISPGYIFFEGEKKPENGWQSFNRVVKRALKGELFVGLWIVFREMIRFDIHTIQYPAEKMEMSPRYRAIHRLLRLFESGNERCIGCGLCEKICIANCIRMDTYVDEKSRKVVSEYSINFGRCIFCGYCAEVCPELAIVHGVEYENASEQRAHFGLKEDMLTPLDTFRAKQQQEFPGFGALSDNADENVKQTPLAY